MSNAATILIVDDDTDFTNTLAEVLTRQNYVVQKACSSHEALQALAEQQYDLVILDLLIPPLGDLGGLGGLETLQRIKRHDKGQPVIVLTADHHLEGVVEAMRLGAYDYLSKPLDCQRLQIVVKNALMTRDLQAQVTELRQQLRDRYGFDSVIGLSGKMQEVFKSLARVLDSSVTVSLRGEAGTGKELLARTIHFNGPRRHQPFVVMNCAGMPERLLEAELFGYEKGAFNGAISQRLGKFEQANGGTIFLDEVGELSPTTQIKILHVLQDRRLERIGGQQAIEVEVRVIAASNKNLEEEMEAGRLRADFYYRLSVYAILIPPLRERKEDIPALAGHFLEKFNRQQPRPVQQISTQAMECLMRYHWPGNVRELENVIEHSMLNVGGGVLLPEHLPPALTSYKPPESLQGTMDLKMAVAKSRQIFPLREIEKALLRQALKITNYNMSSAASELGIGRTTLYRKLQKYQIPLPR